VSTELERKNKKTVLGLLLLVMLMFLFAVALIPLYDILCEVTGINGKTKKNTAPLNYVLDTQREVALEFIASTSAKTHLAFKANQYEIKVHPGAVITTQFTAKNLTNKRMTAKANPSFAPGIAAGYVKNIECFCFETQTFEPGESKQLEVKLLVDPNLPDTYKRITFGLTFFDTTH